MIQCVGKRFCIHMWAKEMLLFSKHLKVQLIVLMNLLQNFARNRQFHEANFGHVIFPHCPENSNPPPPPAHTHTNLYVISNTEFSC